MAPQQQESRQRAPSYAASNADVPALSDAFRRPTIDPTSAMPRNRIARVRSTARMFGLTASTRPTRPKSANRDRDGAASVRRHAAACAHQQGRVDWDRRHRPTATSPDDTRCGQRIADSGGSAKPETSMSIRCHALSLHLRRQRWIGGGHTAEQPSKVEVDRSASLITALHRTCFPAPESPAQLESLWSSGQSPGRRRGCGHAARWRPCRPSPG